MKWFVTIVFAGLRLLGELLEALLAERAGRPVDIDAACDLRKAGDAGPAVLGSSRLHKSQVETTRCIRQRKTKHGMRPSTSPSISHLPVTLVDHI